MAWLCVEYEDGWHVVPDTEAGHVLDGACWCEPELEPGFERLFVHRDELDRLELV